MPSNTASPRLFLPQTLPSPTAWGAELLSIRRNLSHGLPGSVFGSEATVPPSALVHASLALPPAFTEHLAGLIHDQVLQSLGLALLQAELCRRLWENGQGEDAASELAGVVQELESAVDVLRGVMADLRLSHDAASHNGHQAAS